MPKAINVVPGRRYGLLTVIREGDRKFFPSRPKGARTFWCRCDCGNETNVLLSALAKTSGGTASCGCQLIAQPVDVNPGDRFGRLTIAREVARRITPSQPGGVRVFKCRCDCGETRDVLLTSLRQGRTMSCGCLNREMAQVTARRLGEASATHGMSAHPLYETHKAMMARCYNPAAINYPHYGARGVTVCPEWHDVTVFIAWIEASIGPRPEAVTESGHPAFTLDRIDANGNYEPGNVRWADWATQASNKRSSAAAQVGT